MKKIIAACIVLVCICVAAGISFAACGTCGTEASSCQPICNCASCDKACSCGCKYCEKKMNENLAGMGDSTKGAAKTSGDVVSGVGSEAGTISHGAHVTFDDMCKGCLKTSSDIVIGARDSTSRIVGGIADSYDGITNGVCGKFCKKSPAAAPESVEAVKSKPENK